MDMNTSKYAFKYNYCKIYYVQKYPLFQNKVKNGNYG